MIRRQTITSVWMFTREYGQLAGAGGVKDVVAQLSKALARWSARKVHVVLPCYGFIEPQKLGFSLLPDPLSPDRPLEYYTQMNYTAREREERIRVWHKVQDSVRIYLLDAERFREKFGVYTYTREEFQRESWKIQGSGHYDYFAMNILLQKAGLDLIILLGMTPQIIHCHDGHTAVVPALMRECTGYRPYFRDTDPVVTIHNAGVGYHQEVSDLSFVQAITGLPWHVVNESCLDHSFDPFLAAGRYAAVSTVSENYARELQDTDQDYLTGWLGHRLGELGVTIAGITNGVDPKDFDSTSPEQMGIAAGFDVGDQTDNLEGKRICKAALLRELSKPPKDDDDVRSGYLSDDPTLPLYVFIGRLSEQKGIDILGEAARLFLEEAPQAQMICFGSGGEEEEALLSRLGKDRRFSGRFCFIRGFDLMLANKIYAAGDFFIIPSRYEPCGLTDYIAQLFGTLPIVHHVGGLVKVVDEETGFVYTENDPEHLDEALHRALMVFPDKKRMRDMQRAAVEKLFRQHTWDSVMKEYVRLYKTCRPGQLTGKR